MAVPLLQVRNCPDELYQNLTRAAAADRRSIAQETVVLLEEAFKNRTEANRVRRRGAMKALLEDKETHARMTLDPVALIREDRDR
jgi:plasmid stability protein